MCMTLCALPEYPWTVCLPQTQFEYPQQGVKLNFRTSAISVVKRYLLQRHLLD